MVQRSTPEARAALAAVGRAADDDVPWRFARSSTARAPLVDAATAVVASLGRAPEPTDLGVVHEALLAAEARDAGAHYTAPDVARALVDRAAPPAWLAGGDRTVWDPSCGGGAFLLAAAEALLGAGHDPAHIVGRLLHGTDIDPGAIAVTRAALAWWARRHGADADPGVHLRAADTLLDPKASAAGPFDLIVGNPPFQSQLAGATVRSSEELEALRERWGTVVAPYTDTAALFLVAGARALADDGRLCLVLPLSVLSARDAAPARHAVEELTDLVGLWVAGEPVFEADVEVCAPVLHRGARSPERSTVARWRGREVAPIAGPTERDSAEGGDAPARRIGARAGATGERTWAVHALGALGVPDPTIRVGGRLGDLVRTAAGFRDEFYGLVDHVAEAPSDLDGLDPSSEAWPEHLAAVVTSGAIDVGTASWGRRTIRFAGRRLLRPVVDRRDVFDVARAATWVRTTAVPKVVVATQTRVGEAAVDTRGVLLPSTPVVAAFAPVDRLWEVAALVCSPVGSAAALARTAGSGRTAQAVRHTTTSVADLPVPVDVDAWRAGADALRAGDRPTFVDAMADAYDVPTADRAELATWWLTRAPAADPDLDPTPDVLA